MASRRPDLKIPIPKREDGDFQRPPSSVRSPRFIEDFNAPFSEAILDALSNASRTTLATESASHPPTSATSRNSIGGDSSWQTTFKQQSSTQSSSPLRSQDSWGSEAAKAATISGRVREWVRKSREGIRNRFDGKDGYFDGVEGSRRSSAMMSPSQESITPDEPDGHTRTEVYSQTIVSIADLPKMRST